VAMDREDWRKLLKKARAHTGLSSQWWWWWWCRLVFEMKSARFVCRTSHCSESCYLCIIYLFIYLWFIQRRQ
jgi:hypothetical protein